ncbi:MAG: hypothetical protein IPL81_02515 [Flavobacteriales bacterium]|nr:hypothetical protein [Flavobacteriales bacterium]
MRTLLMISITALCLGNATAQNTSTTEMKPAMEQALLKDHVCTDACKDGNHVYAHGEKGHACSAECMKMHEGDAMLKEHVMHRRLQEWRTRLRARRARPCLRCHVQRVHGNERVTSDDLHEQEGSDKGSFCFDELHRSTHTHGGR